MDKVIHSFRAFSRLLGVNKVVLAPFYKAVVWIFKDFSYHLLVVYLKTALWQWLRRGNTKYQSHIVI